MELRQLTYFVGVTRAGSFGRAATELHVAKSALSRQIGLLEDELGVALFVRAGTRREVQLTAAGEALLPEAVTIVQTVQTARERVQAVSGEARGHVGMIIAQGWETWPGWTALIQAFRERYPDVTQTVRQEVGTRAILERVAAGDADIAIIAEGAPPAAPGLRVESLFVDRCVAVLAPDHRLAGRGPLRLEWLRHDDWLLPSVERELVQAAAAPMGWTPQSRIEVPTPSMARGLVLAGEGVTITGRTEAAFWEPAAIEELEGAPISYCVAIAYRESNRNPALRAARDFLRESLGALSPAPEGAAPDEPPADPGPAAEPGPVEPAAAPVSEQHPPAPAPR